MKELLEKASPSLSGGRDKVAREDLTTGKGKDVARTDLSTGESANVAREELIKEMMHARFARIGKSLVPPEIISVLNKVKSNVENERAHFNKQDFAILANSWVYFRSEFKGHRKNPFTLSSIFSNEGDLSDYQRRMQAAWLRLVKEDPTALYDKETKGILKNKIKWEKHILSKMLEDSLDDKKFIEKYGEADD
ncbi:hypothetical protein PsorP6_015063 [Peronosclerospora sorghi]|uniref:Uncharacterized protein n=1 Tax=Peronosclerospora sorghi TaxID=230839 RepID=A0ACC0VT67_9STRA|nr:hypothetical protein PsorP6_015063 [Peronosclerospora sorghi]